MILIVEDDRDIREFLGELLEAEGFTVVGVANGSQARARLTGEPLPSLILLDLMMPEMDGWTLCEELKNDDRLSQIPIILMSGHAKIRQEAAALDAVGYLKKPFDMEHVLALIERAGLSRP